IHFHFNHVGEAKGFSKEDELILYRIIMECTTNILKHAEATEGWVELAYLQNELKISVIDNGKGLSNKKADGIGMRNIQSRVNFLHGKFEVDSSSQGTSIFIHLPYKAR